MTLKPSLLLSVVVPVYNEAGSLDMFHKSLVKVAKVSSKNSYEIIYVDDGSRDQTYDKLAKLAKSSKRVRVMGLSRNFGKEIAITAGLKRARGQAIITIDADGQHPVELIPKFIKQWQRGSRVVVGLRRGQRRESFIKRQSSQLFYLLFRRVGGLRLKPGATDYRLIDHAIRDEFLKITERNRITRGLVDWLGYKQDYIKFTARPRLAGKASYSYKKLFKLAVDSTISLSVTPLFIAAYIGAVVLPLSLIIGVAMVINASLGDPLGWHATGGAYLTVLVVFLVGVLLISQGITGLYLSHIHAETQNRPLYILDHAKSLNLNED